MHFCDFETQKKSFASHHLQEKRDCAESERKRESGAKKVCKKIKSGDRLRRKKSLAWFGPFDRQAKGRRVQRTTPLYFFICRLVSCNATITIPEDGREEGSALEREGMADLFLWFLFPLTGTGQKKAS